MNNLHNQKNQYEIFKLKNDIIFTKSLKTIFAEEYMSVEPDFSPEGQPNGKPAEECFASHQKTQKKHEKTRRQRQPAVQDKSAKFGRQKPFETPNLYSKTFSMHFLIRAWTIFITKSFSMKCSN